MVNYNPVNVRATDDEDLATRLWGDDKKYDDARQQWLPVEKDEGSEEPSPGKTSSTSSTKPAKTASDASKDRPSTAPTTGSSSPKAQTGRGSASSTGGSGKGSQ